MRFLDLILKKKAGQELTTAEINYFIQAYSADAIPDYQVSALLMAICFQGMTDRETADLTLAMARSGDHLDLSAIPGIKVDKHSTGGVGDKTSLIIGPMVACLGVPVAKMSGRGLGHTGGTIDKLESIPGLTSSFALTDFIRQVKDVHLAIAGQTAHLAPADKKLYALRDVTGTVQSPALIAASILSKKIAAGADKVVFDVKCGSGAFMETLEDAQHLGRVMYAIGQEAGLVVHALISNMNQPLGHMVGNRLEVYEAVQTLQGQGPEDLHELCLALAVEMAFLADKGRREDLRAQLEDKLHNGQALAKFVEMVEAQGGDGSYLTQPDQLLPASYTADFLAPEAGYLQAMNCQLVGEASGLLGAGRARLEDGIDPTAGLIFDHKLGAKLAKGDRICRLQSSSVQDFGPALAQLETAITMGDQAPKLSPIILDHIY